MLSLSRALVAGAVLATAVKAGDNFIITQARPLMVSRVDPLVSPGANGPHVHNIIAGSAFSPYSTTPESLEKSKCSSSMVQDDKSAYWAPQLYYKHANGSYSYMRSSTRIYYFLKPLNGTQPVVAFPRGHRMLAGPPSEVRPSQYPPKGALSYEQQQALDPRINAIKWGCSAGAVQGQGDGGSMDGQSPWLPNHAPQGCGVVNQGIFFPSCSDGRLDSPNHFDHMSYPLDGPNGYNCPSSHSTKYPTMFMENFYFPGSDQPYRGPNQDNWIMSNGDVTGLTNHADFINGWEPGVLEQVLSQCNTPNAPGDNLSACAPLAKSLSVDAANNCRSEGEIINEDVGILHSVAKLPGCNDWPADQQNHPTCKGDQVSMSQPSGRAEFPDFKIALPISSVEGTGQSKNVAAGSSSQSLSSSTSATATATSSSTSTTSSSTAAGTTSSEAPAAKSVTSTVSATTSSAYSDPYNYGAAPPAGSSSSRAPTSSADDYNYGVPNPVATTTGSSSSAAPTSASSDDYNYGAPPLPVGSSIPVTTSASSSTAPSSAPKPHAVNHPATTSHSHSVHLTTSTASATPTAQNANAVGGGPKKHVKTCRPKQKKPHHGNGHRRQEWQRRLIN